jgi:hypothetical protein
MAKRIKQVLKIEKLSIEINENGAKATLEMNGKTRTQEWKRNKSSGLTLKGRSMPGDLEDEIDLPRIVEAVADFNTDQVDKAEEDDDEY